MRTPAVMVAVAVLACSMVAPAAADDPTTRVLLTGDSVMQGSSGDWTWRYRLWKHLVGVGERVDFVGPRNDLLELRGGAQDYVDPAFDTDHAAVWATAFTTQRYPVADLVRTYRPDVVVEAFGLNDFIGYWRQPDAVVASAAEFVEQARSADPGVDVVLVTVPQTWNAGVSEYNNALPGLAESLDSPESRVIATAVADVEKYVDTYDAGHLAATGEVKTAAVVADALAQLGVGSAYPRPLPAVVNGPRKTAQLTLLSRATNADLQWTNPPGASGGYLWMRNVSMGEPWVRLAGPIEETAWRIEGLAPGHDYAFRLQSVKGLAVADDLFSNVAIIDRPAPAIGAVQVKSKRRSVRLRWWTDPPSARDVTFTVAWWPKGRPSQRRVRPVPRTRFVIDGLSPRRAYRIAVKAWKSGDAGPARKGWAITR